MAHGTQGKIHIVQLRIPFMFIIGNTDGHAKLVGKYGNCNSCERLCRYCDTPFDMTDQPDHKFTLKK
jgi:hypothetical protein